MGLLSTLKEKDMISHGVLESNGRFPAIAESGSSIQRITDPLKLDLAKPGIFLCYVTPEIATAWLAINIGNRRVRRSLVDYLAKQIVNGEWRDDHPQPGVFSKSRRLIDGQHRLFAIVKTGIAVWMRFEFGADDQVREYLDTGINRTLEDRVMLIEDPGRNRTATQLVTAWHALTNNHANRPSPEQAKEIFENHKNAISWMCSVRRNEKAVSRIPVLLACTEFYELDSDGASEFYPAISVVDGPIQQARVLRDYLLRNVCTSTSRASFFDVRGKCVCAMKAYREGREVKILRASSW